MCGITGIYNLDRKPVEKNLVEKMAGTIKHRGPDDHGIFVDGRVGLGHRRLSIIDLSPAGHQPMSNEDGTVWIVFNGEIYNYQELIPELKKAGHRFSSQSDTEVIIHAYEEYGEKCLSKFNGMWAFAIWDKKKHRLFLARDRMGVKPLYYYQDEKNSRFVFASEIKSILKINEKKFLPNQKMIFDFLFYGFQDHSNETMFEGIEQVPAAHYIEVKDNRIKASRYWDLPREGLLKKVDHYEEKFRELFIDSVNLRLRSDVPVGSCLSGGLDSSSIVAVVNMLLREKGIKSIGERQKTFSSCFEEKRFDERPYIEEVVRATDVESHYTFLDYKDIFKLAEKVTWHQDEPFGGTSIFAQWSVFKLAHQKGMKVMLDGQGADELLAGYHGYFGSFFSEILRRGNFLKFLDEFYNFQKIHPKSLVSALRSLTILSLPKGLVNIISRSSLVTEAKLFKNEFFKKNVSELTIPRRYKNKFNNYLAYLFREASLPKLLHWEDRNSMAFSIESRVPFLDYRLVEFIFALPDEQKIQKGTTKIILRKAMRGLVPGKILNRQDKMGFVTPEEIWFRGNFYRKIQEFLANRNLRIYDFGERKEIEKLLEAHRQGRNYSQLIWRWINLEIWLKLFF